MKFLFGPDIKLYVKPYRAGSAQAVKYWVEECAW